MKSLDQNYILWIVIRDMLDARCPECENVAKVNDEITKVTCPHCKFEASYEKYLEIMKDQALNMATDYIPDRPGF